MYKNRTPDGRNNVCGRNIKKYRKMMSSVPSQRGLAELLQLEGLDIDKNAVQRMESGQRFVTDIAQVPRPLAVPNITLFNVR